MSHKTNKKEEKRMRIDLSQQQFLLKNIPFFLKKVKRKQNTLDMMFLIIIKKNKIKILILIYYKLKFLAKVQLMKMKSLTNGTIHNHQVKRKRTKFLSLTQIKNKKRLIKELQLGL